MKINNNKNRNKRTSYDKNRLGHLIWGHDLITVCFDIYGGTGDISLEYHYPASNHTENLASACPNLFFVLHYQSAD